MDEKKLLHALKIIFSLLLCASTALWAEFAFALANTEKKPEQLLIFVSLGMPKTTLKALYREAQAQGAVLVLRGLQNNSFKKTTQTLQQLGIALQIDPLLFQKYQIKAVPAFVWVTDAETHTLSGNVSLSHALSQFKEAL